MSESIGKKLKKIMIDKNLTALSLSKLAGINHNAVRNILYGRSSRREYIERIEYALGVNILSLEGNQYFIKYDILLNVNKAIVHSFQLLNILEISWDLYQKIFKEAYSKAEIELKTSKNYNHEVLVAFIEGITKAYLAIR